QVREQLQSRRIAFWEKLARTPEEVGGGGHVAASKGSTTSGRQSTGAPSAELEPVIVQGPKLGEVLVRLLEVVAEDLLEFGPAVALLVHAFGPIDESLVERCPGTLENPLVRSIADEDVVEAVLVLPIGLKGPHELLLGH